MIDRDRLAKTKADLLGAHRRIRRLIDAGKEPYRADEKAPLALRYLIISAVEAMADTCQHILAQARGIACEGYVDCIKKAGDQNVIDRPLAEKLRRMADLRNNIVNRYWTIEDERLFDERGGNAPFLSRLHLDRSISRSPGFMVRTALTCSSDEGILRTNSTLFRTKIDAIVRGTSRIVLSRIGVELQCT